MIKWLICLFWGHNLDITLTATETWTYEDGGRIREKKAWCKRCHRFKNVA